MSRLLIPVLALALTAGAAHAQSAPTPEDVTLAAIDACVASDGGRSIANVSPRLGFRPSTKAANRYVRNLPGLEVQVWVVSEKQKDGRTMNVCTVGVWGRLSDDNLVLNDLLSRARVGGFTVDPVERRPKGGVEQSMYYIKGQEFRVFSRIFIPDATATTGANYAITYGWLD
ncbi:MAG: hypothetical protein Q8L66_15745 [Caulobacter sp.]|nr:hypothetical protein [Caulobacter sp.]